MGSFLVRAATPSDIPELAALKREAAERAYGDQVECEKLDAWLDDSCDESFFHYRIGRAGYEMSKERLPAIQAIAAAAIALMEAL